MQTKITNLVWDKSQSDARVVELEEEAARNQSMIEWANRQGGGIPPSILPDYENVEAVVLVASGLPTDGRDYAPDNMPLLWMDAKSQNGYRRSFRRGEDGNPEPYWSENVRTLGRHGAYQLLANTPNDTVLLCSALHKEGLHQETLDFGEGKLDEANTNPFLLDAFALSGGVLPKEQWGPPEVEIDDLSDPFKRMKMKRHVVLDIEERDEPPRPAHDNDK